MHNITLICTVHRKHGKCNSKELYNIIERINPEIIFEEISPFRFNDCYKKHNYNSLESDTIKIYLHNHVIEHIPVDDYDMAKVVDHFKNYNYLNDIFFNNNIDYCDLWEYHLCNTNNYGFEYLNSEQWSRVSKKLHIMEEEIIKSKNDINLVSRYKLWISSIDEREIAMLNNIYNYCKEHNFNNAAFTIGAEHRNSIIKKIQEYNIKKELKLNWNINF